jgi:hypothetical protein
LWHDAWKPDVCNQRSTAETSIARQRLPKHVSESTDEHAVTEEPLEVMIYILSSPKLYRGTHKDAFIRYSVLSELTFVIRKRVQSSAAELSWVFSCGVLATG